NLDKRGPQPVPASATGIASHTPDASQAVTTQPTEVSPIKGVFTGRFRHGPEVAPVRLVIYSDYQCVDCNRIELEVRSLLEQHPEISLSIKQYPFCHDCNPGMK